MKKHIILIVVFAVSITTIINQALPLISWSYFTNNISQFQFSGDEHWSYEGETSPEHWCDIVKNSECNGKKQSPINIIEVDCEYSKLNKSELVIKYHPLTNIYAIKNDGHTIRFDFETGDSILYNGNVYHLKQIHFHEPSEHTINGIRYPIEAHLVHSNAEINEHTVLSILGSQGSQHKPFFFLQSYLPIDKGDTKAINKPFDLTKIIPEHENEYYTYKGSLTTPPCSENVNWIIYNEPIVLSVDQVVKLKKHMPLNNYRNEQELNDRIVYKNFN